MVYSPCFTVRSTSQTIVCYPCCDVYGLYTQMLPSYGQNLDKDSSHGSTQFDPCPPKKKYVRVPVRKLSIVSVLLEDCVLVREAEENELCGRV